MMFYLIAFMFFKNIFIIHLFLLFSVATLKSGDIFYDFEYAPQAIRLDFALFFEFFLESHIILRHYPS